MKKLIDYVKELSDKDIEKIIQSRCNTEWGDIHFDEESVYIKEAIQNMINLDISDNQDGIIISINWTLPEIDYDHEKIIYKNERDSSYVKFDIIKKLPKEKWYEQRLAIEGLDWDEVLGSNFYYEGELFDCLESIINEMVIFGNNVNDCKKNAKEYSQKIYEDIVIGKEETISFDDFIEKYDITLQRKKYDEIYERMKNDFHQTLEQCIIQHNNHLVRIVEQYMRKIQGYENI